MGAFGFHVDQSRGLIKASLSTKNESVFVIRAAVGHVVTFGAADFVTRKVLRGKEFDFGDDDGFVGSGDGVGTGVGDLVRGDEEGVCFWDEDTSFVEVRGSGVVNQALEGWGGADYRNEGVVVDNEGPLLGGFELGYYFPSGESLALSD